ncbi:dephospho-CoA kinase [Arenimonas sp.]|uniref:dephospho-CoA kinase n=1 Tax=Arenimonas sp. TaxID=1872635 RepID=UPI0039E3921F
MAGFVVAVTGGVAAGKSAICALFQSHGIAVADADIVAREIVEPGETALDQIRARFGDGVLKADGQLDRSRLREIIFSDAAAKRELEAITHPRIRQRLRDLCREAGGPYALAAIPLLAEGGGRSSYPWLQRILLVDVPTSLQRRRLLERDGIDEALADSMIAAQASRLDRLTIADDVIVNDGSRDALEAIVERLDRRYRQLAVAQT